MTSDQTAVNGSKIEKLMNTSRKPFIDFLRF